MIVEIWPRGVLGGEPIRLPAAQVVIRRPDGTPIAIAAEYGNRQEMSYAVATVGDADFNVMLRNLGVGKAVQCDRLVLPSVPAEARIISDPTTS